MRQNVGKEKQKSTCFGILFTKITYVQVMNFIPVKVATLYLHVFITFDLCNIGCSFKFPVEDGVEESIVNALRITDDLFKAYRCLCFYTSGAFTIDSSTPTLTGNLNEHPILLSLLSDNSFFHRNGNQLVYLVSVVVDHNYGP
jgi:hypothetical protein